MSEKLKDVASKLDEIENNICELRNHIKSVIEYVQSNCVVGEEAVNTDDGENKNE